MQVKTQTRKILPSFSLVWTLVIFSFAWQGIKHCLAFMNGGHYVVAFREVNLYINRRPTTSMAKPFLPKLFLVVSLVKSNTVLTYFCVYVWLCNQTFLCSCVLIWQQKITKHYVTHIAFVLLVCTFFLLGFRIGETARPLLKNAASGVAKRA